MTIFFISNYSELQLLNLPVCWQGEGFTVQNILLDAAPSVYYPIVCAGMSDEQIRVMEDENALPHGWENMPYEDFLIERRKLMAAKIKAAFEILKKAAI